MIVRKARRSSALVEGLGSEGLCCILDESMAGFLEGATEFIPWWHGGILQVVDSNE